MHALLSSLRHRHPGLSVVGVLWLHTLLCCSGSQGARPGATSQPAGAVSSNAAAGRGESTRAGVGAGPAAGGGAADSGPAGATASGAGGGAGSATVDAGSRGAAGVAGAAGASAGAGPSSAAGSGGQAPAAGSGALPVAGQGVQDAGLAATDAGAAPLTLVPTDAEPLSDGFYAFAPTALPPTNQSPGFGWSSVPGAAQSLALVFRDVSSATPPVKWILWDIDPTASGVVANVSRSSAHPAQVPGASQLGSLGNQGYAGPCCQDHEYEWILYALDVATLPGTAGLSTAQIRMNVLFEHVVAESDPVMMRIAQ